MRHSPCATITLSQSQPRALFRAARAGLRSKKESRHSRGAPGLAATIPSSSRERAAPPWPVPAEEFVVERFDQIGEHRRSRRAMEEHDLVHRERASKPGLIEVGTPVGRRQVAERPRKRQGWESFDGRLETPELRRRVGRLPLRNVEVVQLVGLTR